MAFLTFLYFQNLAWWRSWIFKKWLFVGVTFWSSPKLAKLQLTISIINSRWFFRWNLPMSSPKPKFTATTGRFRVDDKAYEKEFNRYKYDPKKLSWMQRNPKKFIKYFTTFSLLIFFSKPIYDLTIGYWLYDPENPKPRRRPPPHYVPTLGLPQRRDWSFWNFEFEWKLYAKLDKGCKIILYI